MIVSKDFNQFTLLRVWKNVGKICHVEELRIFILTFTLRNMLHNLYSLHEIKLQRSNFTHDCLFLSIFFSFLRVSLLVWWGWFKWKLIIFEWLSEGLFLEIRRLMRLISSLRVSPVIFTLLRCWFKRFISLTTSYFIGFYSMTKWCFLIFQANFLQNIVLVGNSLICLVHLISVSAFLQTLILSFVNNLLGGKFLSTHY